jgi:hypothetical protein
MRGKTNEGLKNVSCTEKNCCSSEPKSIPTTGKEITDFYKLKYHYITHIIYTCPPPYMNSETY